MSIYLVLNIGYNYVFIFISVINNFGYVKCVDSI